MACTGGAVVRVMSRRSLGQRVVKHAITFSVLRVCSYVRGRVVVVGADGHAHDGVLC